MIDKNKITTLIGFGALALWLLTKVLSCIYVFEIPRVLEDGLIFGGLAALGFFIGRKQ